MMNGTMICTTWASCRERQLHHARRRKQNMPVPARPGGAGPASSPSQRCSRQRRMPRLGVCSSRSGAAGGLIWRFRPSQGQARQGRNATCAPCTPPHRLLDISNFARLGIPIASPSVLPHGVSRPGGALAALCTAAGQATIQPCSDRAVHARGAEAYDSVAVGRARTIDTRQPTGGTQPVRLPPPLSSRRPRTADVGPQLAHPCT